MKKFISAYLNINLIFLLPFLFIFIIESVFGISPGGFITGTYMGIILLYHLGFLSYINAAVSGFSTLYFAVDSIIKKQPKEHLPILVISFADVMLNIFTVSLGNTMMVQ